MTRRDFLSEDVAELCSLIDSFTAAFDFPTGVESLDAAYQNLLDKRAEVEARLLEDEE